MNDYVKNMQIVFEKLKQNNTLTVPGNYWQQGCILDTVLDYLKYAIQQKFMSAIDAQAFIASVYSDCYMGKDQHNNPYAQAGCWYDDYGWWGIASSKAFDPSYDQVFGIYKSSYQKIALYCWNIMKNGKGDPLGWYKGAPNVWNNCNQQEFSNVKPRFENGVWQYEIFSATRPQYPTCTGTPEQNCECNNSGNPNNDNLGPFQLSVVNTLYFVLGGRLAQVGQISWTDVKRQYSFFDQWIQPNVSPDEQLVATFGGFSLLRERVSTYYNGKNVGFYNSGSFWGGDQGLFIGGLVIFNAQFPAVSVPRKLIIEITSGVNQKLNKQNVILPWLVESGYDIFENDIGDYASGCGVFMRYLLFAYQHNSDIRTLTAQPDYQTFLRTSADTFANNPPSYGSDNFDLFNQLSVMLTASQLLT